MPYTSRRKLLQTLQSFIIPGDPAYPDQLTVSSVLQPIIDIQRGLEGSLVMEGNSINISGVGDANLFTVPQGEEWHLKLASLYVEPGSAYAGTCSLDLLSVVAGANRVPLFSSVNVTAPGAWSSPTFTGLRLTPGSKINLRTYAHTATGTVLATLVVYKEYLYDRG